MNINFTLIKGNKRSSHENKSSSFDRSKPLHQREYIRGVSCSSKMETKVSFKIGVTNASGNILACVFVSYIQGELKVVDERKHEFFNN